MHTYWIIHSLHGVEPHTFTSREAAIAHIATLRPLMAYCTANIYILKVDILDNFGELVLVP